MNFTGETLTVVNFAAMCAKTWQVHFGQLIMQDVAVYLPGLFKQIMAHLAGL